LAAGGLNHVGPMARHPALDALRAESRACTACELFRHATQTVFGEGPRDARVMLVGEQPGDAEDLQGRPFVGPAGRVLDAALAAAGIDRARVYVTNAVKHFKHELRGKRRLHKKPADAEIDACHRWLEAELAALAPPLVIALGATAVRALLGRALPVLAQRGTLHALGAAQVLVTVHPSYLLRLPPEARAAETAKFVADLEVAVRHARAHGIDI
jgi:DNA polymerase